MLPLSHHFVAVAAETRNRLSGWIAAERRLLLHEASRVEIVALVVDLSARRSGLGGALVRAVEQWAVAEGVASIFVRSNVTRRESHPFYLSLGYRRAKTQHAYRKSLGASDCV
ncbi:MAG: GNAT family N-acetyltransferase [Chthoniobacterales bacterium]